MFKWLFKRFQLEPPKPTRDDVEQSKKAPGYLPESNVSVQKIDLKFPKGVYDLAAKELLKRIKNDQAKMPKPIIAKGKTKPIIAKVPMIPVPHYDYRLLKIIRINIAKGIETIISTPEQIENMTHEDLTEGHHYGGYKL